MVNESNNISENFADNLAENLVDGVREVDDIGIDDASNSIEEAGGIYDILNPLGEALDPIFSPITILPPHIAILIISIILTLMITFGSRLIVNRKALIKLKEEMQEIKDKWNKSQKNGDKDEQKKYYNQLMNANGRYMKHTIRIMFVSIFVVIIFFPWLSYEYTESVVVNLPFTLPILEWDSLKWFWWYVVTAFSVGTILRKIMGSDI